MDINLHNVFQLLKSTSKILIPKLFYFYFTPSRALKVNKTKGFIENERNGEDNKRTRFRETEDDD